MSSRVLERDVQAAIISWVNMLPGCHVRRQNTGARSWKDTRGKKRVVRFGQPGQSDLTGIAANGVRIDIEVKRPGKEPTAEQEAYIDDMRRRGGIAFWADSLDVCVEKMRQEFERRGWTWRKSWEVSL